MHETRLQREQGNGSEVHYITSRSASSAPATANTLHDRDDVSRGRADRHQRLDQLLDTGALLEQNLSRLLLLDPYAYLGRHNSFARRQSRWLRDGEVGDDLDRQITMQDRHRSNGDFVAYHYRASPLVQHDLRPPVGRYLQAVDLGDKLNGPVAIARRRADYDHGGVFSLCDGLVELAIQRRCKPSGGYEIRPPKLQPKTRQIGCQRGSRALDDGSFGNPADRGVIHLYARPAPARAEPPD